MSNIFFDKEAFDKNIEEMKRLLELMDKQLKEFEDKF